MTELQLDAVRDEVSIDDVVADIDETADWSNYEEDEYSLSDIQISLARVLKAAVVFKYTGE